MKFASVHADLHARGDKQVESIQPQPSSPTLIEAKADGILRITLNRPEAANAILAEQRERIIALLIDADRNPDIRAVILAANGRHFCSGADVSTISGVPVAGEAMKRIRNGAQRLITSILDCSKPVVASVQGTAAGLGAHLVFACDLVVASEAASFIEVFVTRGLTVDAGGAYLLPRRIGLQKVKELVFFGDKLSARDAEALGLVNRAVPIEALVSETEALAGRLASGPTMAIGLAKLQLNRSLDSDRASLFLEEAMAQEINSRTEDAREGVAAFIERRAPQFKGY
jgi:2-(1,2-epoxy-1,2-dihydrophenyl)acetyl-CoA isomerase